MEKRIHRVGVLQHIFKIFNGTLDRLRSGASQQFLQLPAI